MKHIFVTILALFIGFHLSAQKKAPNFTVTDYKGNSYNLYDDYLSKDKAVLIKFFFVDCPPCNNIAPSVQQLYVQDWDSGNGRVEFMELSVKSWDNDNKVKGYAQKHGITFPSVGADGESIPATNPYTSGQFGPFFGTPTFAIIGPDSVVHFGIKFNQINDTLTEVLKEDDGENGCPNAFSIDINYLNRPISDSNNILIQLESDIQGSKKYGLIEKEGKHQYECEFELPINNQSYFIEPHYNGVAWTDVSTRDLVLILKHLLGIKLIQNTATKIAADVNDSKSISVSDISHIRKVILGRWTEFSMVNSHRFWDADENFENDTFPNIIPDFRERVPLMDLALQVSSGDFNCVKMGDVTTIENGLNEIKNRSAQNLLLEVKDIYLLKDQIYQIPIRISDKKQILAFQGALSANKQSSEILSVKYHGSAKTSFDLFIDQKEHSHKYLWYDVKPMSNEDKLFTVELKSYKDQYLSSTLIMNEKSIKALYTDLNENEGQIELRFNSSTRGKNQILITPNPVKNGMLSLINNSGQNIKSLTISNLNGQQVWKKDMNSINALGIEINVSSMSFNGIYLINAAMENGSNEINKIIFN